LFLTDWSSGAGGLGICEFILGTVSFAIMISWAFNHTRGSLLIAILMHATLDAFTSTAAGTGLFSAQWMQKYESLAILLGFGVVALVLVAVTRGRLGYQRMPPPSDPVPTPQ
jgi:divalent metal cation (Fe/Co/Zn/Cd) transporter